MINPSHIRKKSILSSIIYYCFAGFIPIVLLISFDLLVQNFTEIPKYIVAWGPGQVRFRTDEFNVLATINEFGFRGRETSLEAGQIVMIGDSYLFGWGVDDASTIPQLIEARLATSNRPLKVYNLGDVGSSPEAHLEIAQSMIPKLKPKMVVLALLQGEDLSQLMRRSTRPTWIEQLKVQLRVYLPGLYGLAYKAKSRWGSQPVPIDVTENWGDQARKLLQSMDLRLPEKMEAIALTGNLNPVYLRLLAASPDYSVAPYLTENVETLLVDYKLIAQKIKQLTERYGGELLLFSMPASDFFDTEWRRNRSLLGFINPPISDCRMDDFVASTAMSIGAHYVSVTPELRNLPSLDGVWFDHDEHLAPYGNEILANLVTNAILEILNGGAVARGCGRKLN